MASMKKPHLQWCNVQFLGQNEVPTCVIASFGENWERLIVLKKKYDLDLQGTSSNGGEYIPLYRNMAI